MWFAIISYSRLLVFHVTQVVVSIFFSIIPINPCINIPLYNPYITHCSTSSVEIELPLPDQTPKQQPSFSEGGGGIAKAGRGTGWAPGTFNLFLNGFNKGPYILIFFKGF